MIRAWIDFRAVRLPLLLDRRTFSLIFVNLLSLEIVKVRGDRVLGPSVKVIPFIPIFIMNLKNAIGQKMLLVKEMEEEIKELHEKCTLMDTEKSIHSLI